MTAAAISAAFSAVAAIAACVAVGLDIWKSRRARLPELVCMPTSPSAGPSCRCSGQARKKTVYVDAPTPAMGTVVPAIVWCRALDRRVHWWTSDERDFSASVGGFPWPRRRRFKSWPKAPDMFGPAYPQIAIPDDDDGATGGATAARMA